MYNRRFISDRIKDYLLGTIELDQNPYRTQRIDHHPGVTVGAANVASLRLGSRAPIARRITNHPETRTTKCGCPLPALVTTFRVTDRYPPRTKTQARRGNGS